ncbi:MAG: DUF6799 domain-containing protein [Ginsengibacter sp.]
MKRIFLSVFAIALSFGAFAQETTVPKDTTIKAEQQAPTEQQVTVGQQAQTLDVQNSTQQAYIMQDGKMYQYNNGVKSEISNNVTLSNGIVITSTGTVTKADGTIETLKDGQYVDLVGNIAEWNDKK